MKITVLMGSPRKKDGYTVCKKIEESIATNSEITFNYIHLKDYIIEECKGCGLCFRKGEDFCPIKDDINKIIEQLKESDGIIFVAPVYACQIPGSFKKVIDRMAYLFHRPELIGKPALTIVTTDGGGIKPTLDYLRLTAVGFGCNIVGQSSVISSIYFENSTYYNEKYCQKKNLELQKLAQSFLKTIVKNKPPKPTYYDIYMFNGLKSKTIMSEIDNKFWKEKGWLDSPYYYPTSMGLGKIAFGFILSSFINLIINFYTKWSIMWNLSTYQISHFFSYLIQ